MIYVYCEFFLLLHFYYNNLDYKVMTKTQMLMS